MWLDDGNGFGGGNNGSFGNGGGGGGNFGNGGGFNNFQSKSFVRKSRFFKISFFKFYTCPKNIFIVFKCLKADKKFFFYIMGKNWIAD